MSAPTLTEIRAFMETDLDDTNLGSVINAESNDVDLRFGAETSQVDEILEGRGRFLFPTRKIGTITSVVEIEGDTETTLAGSDYQVILSSAVIERLPSGTGWASRVRVTYAPEADPRRKMVIVDLVRLALQHNALRSEQSGNYRSDSVEYQKERELILSRLFSGGKKLFA